MALDYQAWFNSAKAELEALQKRDAELEQERAELKRKITALAQSLRAVGPLVGEEQPPTFWKTILDATAAVANEIGLTAGIRGVLQNSPNTAFSPTQIRDTLQMNGWNMDVYSSAMSTIHAVLQRLVKSGEVREIVTVDGKKYQWAGLVIQSKSAPHRPAVTMKATRKKI